MKIKLCSHECDFAPFCFPAELTVENMGQRGEAEESFVNILKYDRELLVSRLRSIPCILDNLSASGFFCEEDVEIIQKTVTRTDQAGKTKKMFENIISNSYSLFN